MFSFFRRLRNLEARVKRLEDGGSPDYEKALKAAQAVNDFNDGLSGILNFDPMQIAKERREGGA